jgi:ribosomal protein S18 acetylase RimI-like enzyme
LVRCVEDIAKTSWNYKKMYLHVDLDNTAARKLYEKEGYKDVGQRWKPFWAGKAADIGYFVKKLES